MDNKYDVLRGVFSRVLEEFTFSFAESVDLSELVRPEDKIFVGEIEFALPAKGVISAAAPRELCAAFAANMVGADPDELSPEMVCDSLKEILNVTCGEFAEQIEDSETMPQLTIPSIRDLSLDEWKKMLKNKNAIFFLVDDLPMIVSLKFL